MIRYAYEGVGLLFEEDVERGRLLEELKDKGVTVSGGLHSIVQELQLESGLQWCTVQAIACFQSC